MTFREDTVIFVVAKNDDGWFEGVIEPGIRGLFPVSDSLLIRKESLAQRCFREITSNLYVNECVSSSPFPNQTVRFFCHQVHSSKTELLRLSFFSLFNGNSDSFLFVVLLFTLNNILLHVNIELTLPFGMSVHLIVQPVEQICTSIVADNLLSSSYRYALNKNLTGLIYITVILHLTIEYILSLNED